MKVALFELNGYAHRGQIPNEKFRVISRSSTIVRDGKIYQFVGFNGEELRFAECQPEDIYHVRDF